MLVIVLLAIVCSVANAQVTQACLNDIQSVLNGTIQTGSNIYTAVVQCSQGDTPACTSAIKSITNGLSNLTQSVTTLAKDCFGNNNTNPNCAHRIQVVTQDFNVITTDAVQMTSDCGPNGNQNACTSDIQNLAADVTRAVSDLTFAVTICAGNRKAPLLQSLAVKKLR